jgi:hypothetical protein
MMMMMVMMMEEEEEEKLYLVPSAISIENNEEFIIATAES